MKHKKDLFTGRMFRALWVPAMLSSFGLALSDMADAIVVGQKLGAIGLATIGLILPIYMINSMFTHGLGIGGSVRYSRLLSQGKTADAAACFNGVFYLALILSVSTAVLGTVFIEPLLTLLGTAPTDGALYTATESYLRILILTTPLFYLSQIMNYFLRNDGNQRLAGIGSVTGNICDICLNILLVLALDMGTGGAALSTALGQIISIGIYLPGWFDKKHTLHFSAPDLCLIRQAFVAIRMGLATSVQYLYQMIFFLICNNMLIRLGGTTHVTVFDLIQNTSYLVLYLFEGTGRAMQPILSTYHSEHNRPGIKYAARLGFTAGLATGGLLIAFIEFRPMSIFLLFGLAGSAIEATALSALRFYGIAALFAGTNILLCSCFQACENEKPSFVLETLRGAVLLIPLTFVCSRLGTELFWLLFLLTEAGSLALFALLSLNGRFRKTEIADERIFHRTIPGTYSDVMDACRSVEKFCDKWDADIRQKMLVTMTIEEIGTAILKHGFKGRTDGYIQITAVMNNNGILELHLRDDATTFNPFAMKPQQDGADTDFDMDSIGVLVIKERSRSFFYHRYQGFNTLIIQI